MVFLQHEGRRQIVLLTTYLLIGGNLVVSIGLAPRIHQSNLTYLVAWFGQQSIAVLVLTHIVLLVVATVALLGLHFVTTVGSETKGFVASAVTEGLLGGLLAGSLVFLVNNLSLLFDGSGVI